MLRKVPNRNAYKTANKYYYHLRDKEGVYYLFSQAQVDSAAKRAEANPEDTQYEFEEQESSFAFGVLTGIVIGALSCVVGYAFCFWAGLI